MSILTTLRESPAPAVAVEIAAGRVSAASLEWRGGQAVVVGARRRSRCRTARSCRR